MTSTVTIDAHCASDTEVSVSVYENYGRDDTLVEEFTLQDGESAERAIYDNREITVKERIRRD